ncbi:MAG: two-component sensor histidine kinase, partial [Spongiibacter sp.]|nr:two-component sensor histidine kinase [Spongiibacter sp.]
MYKRKVIAFAGLISVIVMLTSALVVATTQITRTNLTQNNIAQALLNEHILVSGTSYRLFKQLTDELIFGKDANQAEVRNKSAIIQQSIAKIIELEERQRQALGEEATQGSVEDTGALAALLDEIISEFRLVIAEQNRSQLQQREKIQRLLEVLSPGNRPQLVINL